MGHDMTEGQLVRAWTPTIDITPRMNEQAIRDYADKHSLQVDERASAVFAHVGGRLLALDELREQFEDEKETVIRQRGGPTDGRVGINIDERLIQLDLMDAIRHKAHSAASEDLLRMFGDRR